MLDDLLRAFAWGAAAYLLGSLPTAYLAGRLVKGIDIRDYGSGNVGGANVSIHVGMRAAAVVGLIDFAKGALAVGLARWLEPSVAVWALASLAVVTGHNWSLFLGFAGGRGVGTGIGAIAVLDPLALAATAGPGFLILGLATTIRRKVLAVLTLATAVALVIVAWLLHGPSIQTAGDAAVVGALVLKRLLGNPGPRPPIPLRRLLLHRILLDRDVASHEAWVYREPATQGRPEARPTEADPQRTPG